MGSNNEIRRLAQEAEKQQLFAQKVQQQNTNLTSQLEMYKERVRILEGINKDNNYLNEFLEADERAKRYNRQAQSQFVRDRDIIRDLEKQRDKLELDVKDYKRQKEEYQKTQTIFNQTQCNKEEKYLDDILQFKLKSKILKMLFVKWAYQLKHFAYAKIPKLYNAYELCNKSEQLHVFDSEETLEDAEKSQLKMNDANPMFVDLNEMEKYFKKLYELLEINCKRENIFYTSKEEQRLIDVCVEAKYILQNWRTYFEVFQKRFNIDVKEIKDVFVSMENDLDETFKQNELLKDRLLEASLVEDIKNLVITSCVEIRNKDLHDEIDRISKESKDVSNESKTADTVCNDAFGVTRELSKRIVELEKDLSKFEAKSIVFEIALQHKSRENNSLKTVQKENENFMASLELENAHLKQTYKDLFESV
ncbi:hypothetical protein Tco_0479148 [Tanacetum coccineum]